MTLNGAIMQLVELSEHPMMPVVFRPLIQKVIETISELEENPEPHWIPVTERLPEEDGSYLVSGKWGSGKESVGDCEFSVEDGYFQTAWNFDVLAWMPLPEPFKGATT